MNARCIEYNQCLTSWLHFRNMFCHHCMRIPANFLSKSLTTENDNRPFHGNCGAVIGACAQMLPDGNIFLTQNGNMHCVVYKCSNRQNSAAKENGIIVFYLPQGCEEEKVLGKCCQQDRLVTT